MNNTSLENGPIYSGLKDWDEAIGGCVPEQFILLAGRSVMGKSAFAISLVKKLQ